MTQPGVHGYIVNIMGSEHSNERIKRRDQRIDDGDPRQENRFTTTCQRFVKRVGAFLFNKSKNRVITTDVPFRRPGDTLAPTASQPRFEEIFENWSESRGLLDSIEGANITGIPFAIYEGGSALIHVSDIRLELLESEED